MKDDPLNRTKVLRGSNLPQAKLTEHDVRLIRELIEHRQHLRQQAADITNAKLAEKFSVHERTIDRISRGETWGHVWTNKN